MPAGPTIVTGAAGFAGGHLLELLKSTGVKHIVGWDHRENVQNTASQNWTWRGVDLLDRESVRAAIAQDRPASLYHLAGVPHVGDSWQEPLSPLRVHVSGTANLLDAVREFAPGCRILVVSSGLIYRQSESPLAENAALGSSSPYGFSKIAQDQLACAAADADGLDVVVARPFNHTGPRQQPGFSIPGFARQIALIERGEQTPEIQVGNLDAKRDLTDVRDVVQAYQRIMSSATLSRAFNVCSGVALRIGDLLDRLIALSPTRITTSLDTAKLRPSDVPIVLGDPSRIRNELGWTPAISVDRMLADVLEYWRSQPSPAA